MPKQLTKTSINRRDFITRLTGLALISLICSFGSAPTHANDEIWNQVKTGDAFIIMRHALAPGTGDPGNFDLNQCETQRNLSAQGVQQAQRIGQAFKEIGILSPSVYSSQWCRCIDTATAMELQPPEELPYLNSFFNDRSKGPAQIKGLVQWLKDRDATQPLIMITHQVVITALTGVYPASGEAVVFRFDDDGNVEVIHEMLVK